MSKATDAVNTERDKIIIFAGIFDPVHNGHLSIAKKALECGEKLIFLPERVPQHKHGATTYEHRYAMLKIVIEDQPNMEVLDYPRDQQFISDTFRWLKLQFPDKKFVWLMGNDVIEHLPKWPDVDKLAELDIVEILVGTRGSLNHATTNADIVVPVNVVTAKNNELNSSSVRSDLISQKSNLPIRVREYIENHGLYTSINN